MRGAGLQEGAESAYEHVSDSLLIPQALVANTEVVKDKSKAKRRKLERELAGAAIKEKNALPKDAFRVEHLNYKVRTILVREELS